MITMPFVAGFIVGFVAVAVILFVFFIGLGLGNMSK
jgi:hypothetical protein